MTPGDKKKVKPLSRFTQGGGSHSDPQIFHVLKKIVHKYTSKVAVDVRSGRRLVVSCVWGLEGKLWRVFNGAAVACANWWADGLIGWPCEAAQSWWYTRHRTRVWRLSHNSLLICCVFIMAFVRCPFVWEKFLYLLADSKLYKTRHGKQTHLFFPK